MSEDRESFVFHKDWYYAIKKRSPLLRIEIYDAIMEKVFEGTQKELSEVASVVMDLISPQIDRDTEKWLNTREKRSLAGKKHKGNQYRKVKQTEQNGTNGTSVPTMEQMKQDGTNGTVSVSDSVSVDNNSVILKEKSNTIVSDRKKTHKSNEPIVIAPEMQEVVDTWMQYKKEKGQSYKPTGFSSFYKKLCKLSNNNPQVAMAIIEESMGNNYAGIFPLKNNNNYGRETITDKIKRTVEEANIFSQQLSERIGNDQQADVCDGNNDEVW